MFYSICKQVLILSLFNFLFSSVTFSAPIPNLKTIAITQIVGHQALDKVHQGIIDELAKKGYEDGKQARIVFENAQGNVVVASQIAQQFTSLHPNVIVAIATPSAQAVANAIKKTTIPLVFASISDPVQAKLVMDLNHPGANITGTRNVSPVDKQIALIKEILPQVKTIGIVLNFGEINSVNLLQTVITEGKRQNIEVKSAPVATPADVQTAVNSLMGKVDALLLLQDNMVASALPALIKVTNANHVPVFTTFLDAIKEGAFAGLAFNEYSIGRQTGKIVVDILKGKKASEIPVQDPSDIELAVNLDAARELNLKINESVLSRANLVYPTKVN